MQLSVHRAETLKTRPADDALTFGTAFTDHMFNMDYTPEAGWHDPRIEPYAPFQLDPSTMVFHYGQAIFEGLKAFRREDGGIQLFRPKDNLARFNRSAERMCIPAFDEDAAFSALTELIRIESDWVPSTQGTALYIRPTIIATDAFLGVRASNTYRFFIILCPVGAYYAEGFNPVKIWVTKDFVRAVPGGVGEAKTAGNYAASLYASEVAAKKGYTQVLWLDGVEKTYVEEVGSMNIFFVLGDTLVTPMLTGSILQGITRDTVLTLARSWGLSVEERRISVDELVAAHEKGDLKEVFGAGTAAVISPVGTMMVKGREISIGDGGAGALSMRFFNAITDIQYGRAEDPFGWIVPIS
ncbi:MAG: branched chain amino acid aminotransferase [Deltaproteobacteria bacterium]|nr:MAG: branched chain amino acid aminotransferase [Deltaproteobacteria bacterium]